MIVDKSIPLFEHMFVPSANDICTDLCRSFGHAVAVKKPPKPIQTVVGENIAAILKERTLKVVAGAKLLKVKPFQLRRILAGKHAMTLRSLERAAAALKIEPYQLLVPGLNPARPQLVRYLTPTEDVLYAALEAARAELPQ